jgi:DNA mismatch repair protein MutL
MPIALLPERVASQIAAGEVVERPASVVKELVENGLDAGARAISVRILGGGQRLIEVADDGCGIPATEIALAVQRHATSKLTSADDLFHIQTLGFRGEALASIGSVARLHITSRPSSTDFGATLTVDGGKAGKVAAHGAPVGTQVQVEDLFYNIPARRKFLKKETTERRLIDTLVARYALANPAVRFRLSQEEKIHIQTTGNGNEREILAFLYGPEVARQMLEVLFGEEGLHVHGFISPANLTRTNRSEITFYINRRPIQDAGLTAALLQAYHTYLMVGRYPLAALFLEMDAEAVDVNVHPTKAEVRFRERERVFSAVQRASRLALLSYSPVPALHAAWGGIPPYTAAPGPDPAWEMDADAQRELEQVTPHPSSATPPPDLTPPFPGMPHLLRPIGQVAATYLIAEGPDGLYLIDQHAAHERILFEDFLARAQTHIDSQILLEPVLVEISPSAAHLLEEQIPILARLGFELEAFGHNTFRVRAVPAILAASEPAAIIRTLVEDFEEDETPLQGELEARLIARICKRAAVKAGKVLSAAEQEEIIRSLEVCQTPRTCPHGRPTMIHLSVDLLERQFGRRGAR